MPEPADRSAARAASLTRSGVYRILGNAGLLAFASLLVISLAAGRLASGLLWCGALLVFFAPALERRNGAPVASMRRNAGGADTLRWCGLACALAGAAAIAL